MRMSFMSRSAGFTVMCIAALLSIEGCAKKVAYEPQSRLAKGVTMANIVAPASAPMGKQTPNEPNTLAYEHVLQIEIDKELLATRVEAVRAACAADQDDGCQLLEISNSDNNGVAQGRIKVRVAPKGVEALTKLAAEGGRVLSKDTNAEDLAQPIADTDRQLALLNLHRDRLVEFMRRKDIKVSDLITVSRELATVQSQLDSYGQERANLKRRVDTELLTIHWSPPFTAFQSAESPILNALKSFGADFKAAVAQVITFLAYVIPWMVIVIPLLLLVRWMWRRLRLRRASQEAASS